MSRPWAGMAASMGLVAGALLAQGGAYWAFLALMPADTPVRGGLMVCMFIGMAIYMPFGKALTKMAEVGRPNFVQRLKMRIEDTAKPPEPEFPELGERAREMLMVAAGIALWWGLFALSPLVCGSRLLTAHQGWIGGAHILGPVLTILAVMYAVQPLFEPLPADTGQRSGIL